MVGKWDMGQAKRYLPLQRGFDFFYGHGNNGIDYYTHERYGVHSMFRGNDADRRADKGKYATDLFKREALQFIARAASDQPWFLYLCFNAPHGASSFGADDEGPEVAEPACRRPRIRRQVRRREAHRQPEALLRRRHVHGRRHRRIAAA